MIWELELEKWRTLIRCKTNSALQGCGCDGHNLAWDQSSQLYAGPLMIQPTNPYMKISCTRSVLWTPLKKELTTLTVHAAKETVNKMNHLADLVSKNLGRFDSFPPWRKPKIRLHDPIVATKEG